jgi:hypothetical protein
METVEQLQIPVPPMLEAALGYTGTARYVAFFWGAGDEVYWDDGWSSADGESAGWLAFTRHRRVSHLLAPYHFGDSDTAATHWLLVDRATRICSVGTAAVTARVLQRDNTAPETARGEFSESGLTELDWDNIVESFEELNATITPDEIFERLEAHACLVRDMTAWLDTQEG